VATNAQKGGVKTPGGKAISRFNAIKHGLLAQEIVVLAADRAEDPDTFAALLKGLQQQFDPQGAVEGLLVEKIAVAYWRLRRACRYESGLVQRDIDQTAEHFYNQTNWKQEKIHKTDQQLDQEIAEQKEWIADWQNNKRQFRRMKKDGRALADTYDQDGAWEDLGETIDPLIPEDYDFDDYGPKEICEFLHGHAGWTDDKVWKALSTVCDEHVASHQKKIQALEKQKQRYHGKIAVLQKLGNVPSHHELNRLLRYETAIERQFYKALNQLERMQRLRAGDTVPPPLEVEVDVSGVDGT